jgi:hypothetical protein
MAPKEKEKQLLTKKTNKKINYKQHKKHEKPKVNLGRVSSSCFISKIKRMK